MKMKEFQVILMICIFSLFDFGFCGKATVSNTNFVCPNYGFFSKNITCHLWLTFKEDIFIRVHNGQYNYQYINLPGNKSEHTEYLKINLEYQEDSIDYNCNQIKPSLTEYTASIYILNDDTVELASRFLELIPTDIIQRLNCEPIQNHVAEPFDELFRVSSSSLNIDYFSFDSGDMRVLDNIRLESSPWRLSSYQNYLKYEAIFTKGITYILNSLGSFELGYIDVFQPFCQISGDIQLNIIEYGLCGNPEKCSNYFKDKLKFDMEQVRLIKSYNFTLVYGRNYLKVTTPHILERNHIITLISFGAEIASLNRYNLDDYELIDGVLKKTSKVIDMSIYGYPIPIIYTPTNQIIYTNPGDYNLTVSVPMLNLSLSWEKKIFARNQCFIIETNSCETSYNLKENDTITCQNNIQTVDPTILSLTVLVAPEASNFSMKETYLYDQNLQLVNISHIGENWMKITDKNFITDDDSQEFLLMNMAPENESEVRGFEFLINSPVDYNSEILIYKVVIDSSYCQPAECYEYLKDPNKTLTAQYGLVMHLNSGDLKIGYNQFLFANNFSFISQPNSIYFIALNFVKIGFSQSLNRHDFRPSIELMSDEIARISHSEPLLYDNLQFKLCIRPLVFDPFYTHEVLINQRFEHFGKYEFLLKIENSFCKFKEELISIEVDKITENSEMTTTTTTKNTTTTQETTTTTTITQETTTITSTASPESRKNISNYKIEDFKSAESLLEAFSEDNIPDIKFENLHPKLTVMLLKEENDITGCLTNCSNHGACVVAGLRLVCNCSEFFIGDECQIDTRPCSSQSCQYNGTCWNNGTGPQDFYCECVTGRNNKTLYTGKYCEHKVNVCEEENCSFHGLCYDNYTEPACRCFKHFHGVKCEIESVKLKTISSIKTAAVAISVCTIAGIIGIFMVMDLAKLISFLTPK